MKPGDLVRIEGCALPLGIITSMRPRHRVFGGAQYVTVYEFGSDSRESTSYEYGDECLEVISESR